MTNLTPCAIAYINSDDECEQIDWLPSSLTSDPDCILLVRDTDALAEIERLEASLKQCDKEARRLRKRNDYLMSLSEYFEDNHDEIFCRATRALAVDNSPAGEK